VDLIIVVLEQAVNATNDTLTTICLKNILNQSSAWGGVYGLNFYFQLLGRDFEKYLDFLMEAGRGVIGVPHGAENCLGCWLGS